mmetsp:Transcript_23780/g.56752  ORF Transcript_23780/g.56752 Transcript_23780/m.56752 type:complete len:254 (+) Transcript_23780:207-968(+)
MHQRRSRHLTAILRILRGGFEVLAAVGRPRRRRALPPHLHPHRVEGGSARGERLGVVGVVARHRTRGPRFVAKGCIAQVLEVVLEREARVRGEVDEAGEGECGLLLCLRLLALTWQAPLGLPLVFCVVAGVVHDAPRHRVRLGGVEAGHVHLCEDAHNVLHLDETVAVGVEVTEGRRRQRRLHAQLAVLVVLGDDLALLRLHEARDTARDAELDDHVHDNVEDRQGQEYRNGHANDIHGVGRVEQACGAQPEE